MSKGLFPWMRRKGGDRSLFLWQWNRAEWEPGLCWGWKSLRNAESLFHAPRGLVFLLNESAGSEG